MNYEQNEIDDIFKKGFENQASPYKNEYWNLMEEMLDEKRPSIYGFGYKKWLSYVGLSSLVMVMMLIGSGSYHSENVNAQTNKNINYPLILPVISTSNIVSNENEKSIILKGNKTTQSNNDRNNNSNVQTVNFVSKKSESNINNTFPSTFISNNTENNTGINNLVSPNNEENITEPIMENRMANMSVSAIYHPDFYVKNNSLISGFDKKYQPNPRVGNTVKPKIVETENMLFEKKQPSQNEKVSEPTKNNSTKKANKTEVVSVANLDFHILGGPTIGNAFNTSENDKNKTKMGYMGGFGFGYYFNKKLSLSMDIMYQKRNGHELERKVTNEEFFLYKKSQTYTLKTFNTDYLVLPIQVKYQVKKHHAIGLGIYTNFLLNSYNTIFLTTSTTNNSSKIEESHDKVNYGNWETVNYGYTINYEFNPTKNIGVGVGYYKGMKDATINSFYRNDKKDMMSDFTLTLKYYLK